VSVFAKWNESVEIAITKQRNVRLKEKRDLNQKLILEDPASTMKVKSLTLASVDVAGPLRGKMCWCETCFGPPYKI